MTCSSVEQGDIIERYLHRGALSEAEAEAFELHYFACPDCFELLKAARAARSVLMQGSPRVMVGTPRSNPFKWMALAAGIFIAAVGIWLARRRTTEPAQLAKQVISVQPPTAESQAELKEFARYDPPLYQAVVVRGQ